MNGELAYRAPAREGRAPALVLHRAGDRVAPPDEGRLIAREIPNASFVESPGDDQVLLPGRPAFDRFLDETRAFLSD